MKRILIALALTLGLSFAGASAPPQAEAVSAYYLSNTSNVGLWVASSAGGYFIQQPYTKSYYPDYSKWYVGVRWACTFHHPYGSNVTYYGGSNGLWVYLHASNTVVTACWAY